MDLPWLASAAAMQGQHERALNNCSTTGSCRRCCSDAPPLLQWMLAASMSHFEDGCCWNAATAPRSDAAAADTDQSYGHVASSRELPVSVKFCVCPIPQAQQGVNIAPELCESLAWHLWCKLFVESCRLQYGQGGASPYPYELSWCQRAA